MVASCSAAQTKSEVTYGAVVASCDVLLKVDRDAGAAGAADEIDQGCRKTLRVWQRQP